MSKHTEGPWKREGADKTYIVDEHNIAICSVWQDHQPREQNMANAQLIATAPRLFMALEVLLQECELEGLPDTWDSLVEARAALAEATSV